MAKTYILNKTQRNELSKKEKLSDVQNNIKSNTAVILGTGSSINLITDTQWEQLKKFDLWAVNNWIYHPFIVPNFYHIEVKEDRKIMKERLEEKWNDYKNVIYIVPRNQEVVLNAIGHLDEAKIYYYEYIKRNNCAVDANYPMIDRRYTRSFNASISVVLEMVYRFGYKNIILAGIDLYNSKYFWTDGDPNIYGRVHIQFNKDGKEGKTMNDPHQISHITEFIIDFNSRHCLPNGKEIYIINSSTVLYPSLRVWEEVNVNQT
jgi:hypothetical protein